ncbi:hypothetical protein CRUP_021939 [Coryphaenoides rupestris]|nr:hypothetical protein CRUP_021939 [Coryphaenoides rupestris]
MAAAPLAHCDEDWQDFNEFQPPSSEPPDLPDRPAMNSNVGETTTAAAAACGLDELPDPARRFSGEFRAFESVEEGEGGEDLVRDFDEKLAVCFRNYSAATENMAPVRSITEEHFLKDDQVWNALADNYGNVMPVDWKTSHTRTLHLPTLNLRPHEDDCSSSTHQSDLSTLSTDLHALKHSQSNSSYQDRLRQLSVCELTEGSGGGGDSHREELIQALALRDELDYEKEVKNSFISLLIDVQNRQKAQRELLRKRRKGPQHGQQHRGARGQRTTSTHVPGTYLTTVIPYEKKAGSPSVEDLQILTKILHAMRDDSDKVPSLLTDYILKVLCPT